MKRVLALLLVAGAVAAPLASAAAHEQSPTERRVAALAAQIRCPVCQNLSVKDSPSEVATSFRARIRELVRAGRSDAEIRAFFVARYGEWILLSPPKRGIGLAVWLAPALLLGVGLAVATISIVRWTRRGRELPPAPDRLDAELEDIDAQLAEGELEPGDHELLRARRLRRRPDAPLQRRAPRWRWPLAGAAVAAVVVATLLPALRQRGANDFSSGNDFGASQTMPAGIAEWRAAEAAVEAGRLKPALERYRLAVAFEPEIAALRARYGFALAQAGRSRPALAQLRRAVAADPGLADARLYLGAVLLKVGQRDEGARQWRRFLELQPEGKAAALVRRQLADLRSAREPGARG